LKKLICSLVLLTSCFSLAACSSRQDVGTLTGALAGGLLGSTVGGGSGKFLAVAAGTLAGAYFGGYIGKSMDDTDKAKANHALESNPVGQPAYWQNTNTGASYQVTPTKNVTVKGNNYCREYQTTANVAGKKQQVYGTACRQSDGSWKTIS
jgi:surface antigen